MSKKLFIANWKSHKTKQEAIDFFEHLKERLSGTNLDEKEIVIAPPFTLLSMCYDLIHNYKLPIKLASQNLSSFPQGAYTGEINASQVKEFAEYSIVGHSERRKYLHEVDSDLANKIHEAKQVGLEVIQCIQDENSIIHQGATIVAYEPPSAIGSGNPDSPEHIKEVFDKILEENQSIKLIYGGSVNSQTINSFMQIERLEGFLIGGASLDPDTFLSMLS